MTTWLVSRHPGAIEWLNRQGFIDAQQVPHLDIEQVQAGDRIIGTLPVNIAAEVCAKGAVYYHLSLKLTPELRGKELTAEQMDQLGASLQAYSITPLEENI